MRAPAFPAAPVTAGPHPRGGSTREPLLEAVGLLGRINPACGGDTYGALRTRKGLAGRAAALCDALMLMYERGERELLGLTLPCALRVLGGERRAARIVLAPERTCGQQA